MAKFIVHEEYNDHFTNIGHAYTRISNIRRSVSVVDSYRPSLIPTIFYQTLVGAVVAQKFELWLLLSMSCGYSLVRAVVAH